jgi:hypothetical protein
MKVGSNPPDARPLQKAAETIGMPLTVIEIDEPAVVAAYERSLVLVRPDGHVAWRGNDLNDPESVVRIVCGFVDGEAQEPLRPERSPQSVEMAQSP